MGLVLEWPLGNDLEQYTLVPKALKVPCIGFLGIRPSQDRHKQKYIDWKKQLQNEDRARGIVTRS